MTAHPPTEHTEVPQAIRISPRTDPHVARRPVPVTALAMAAIAATATPTLPTAPLTAQTPEVIVGPNLRVAPGGYNEPWIAASPDNPDFLIAVTQTGGWSFPGAASASLAARTNAAFLTRDGGVSWERINLPGTESGAFDPMVVPGPDGRMWILYTYVGANTLGGLTAEAAARMLGTIKVWSTDDEGATWVGPAELRSPVPPDHPRIAADWSDGPHRTRRCWELFFASSSDGGESFSANVPVATAPSCPPPTHAPVVRVHNLATDPDIEDVPADELAKMDLIQRMTTQMAQQGREARARYFGDLDHATLEVTFDNARGNQPGHYLGLAADADGVFHPLWISRRNAVDELFTTTVEVAAGAPAAPAGEEMDITAHLLVVAGPVVFDAAGGKATLDVQLRNVSDGVVHGPVRLRAVGGGGREWSFAGKMGSHDRLAPGGLSEPVKVEIETGSGVDGRLDFRIFGRVTR